MVYHRIEVLRTVPEDARVPVEMSDSHVGTSEHELYYHQNAWIESGQT